MEHGTYTEEYWCIDEMLRVGTLLRTECILSRLVI